MDETSLSRRQFVSVGAVAATAAFTAPSLGASPLAEKLRVGLIGVGNRGTAHLRNLLRHPGARVVAICDIDEGARSRAVSAVREVYGSEPASHRDYRKLLEDGTVGAVFSATPCDAHHAIYIDTIAAGKHLYAEKPLCLTAAQAAQLVALEEKYPAVKVQVGFQRRCDPRVIEGVKLIREDRVLGDLVEGRAAYNNSWGPKHGLGGPGSWQSRRERSGDWMLEQAVHAWDLLNWVAGATPLRAFGLGNPEVFKAHDPDRDVTDYYGAILEYPDNLVVQFSHSWISPRDAAFDGTYVRFVGRLGGIDLDAGKIVYSARAAKAPEKTTEWLRKEIPNPTTGAIESFIETIVDDRTPAATVHHGRDATLVGLLVRKAVYERRPVEWAEVV